MNFDLKQELKTAVEQCSSEGRLGHFEFAEQLVEQLTTLGLDARTEREGHNIILSCDMDKDNTPGFKITFKNLCIANLEANEYSVSPKRYLFERMESEQGQKDLVELIGKWLFENSTTKRLNEIAPDRQKPNALAL